jgi:hypothetical protein
MIYFQFNRDVFKKCAKYRSQAFQDRTNFIPTWLNLVKIFPGRILWYNGQNYPQLLWYICYRSFTSVKPFLLCCTPKELL